ncbi:DNA mismatch repair protein [Tsukamurella sp. 8F]|uniref:MutS-related protein n=1 Tax=unclassified Tsukamurella TaxID=2633480 RepID=UPI0023B8A2FB|nr:MULTISPECIES: DNA mismatch repair protein [unclassified Tsukamurella]MDF0531909.1 DNA mismatch repair protein [Tsukamurella sp. 8J]MDF0586951.1 DNA mismatch repair protein [Tsukamurella sp. 8F]
MKTRLLFRDHDLSLPALQPRSEELRRDLGVDRLLAVMSGGGNGRAGDDSVYRVAEAMLLGGAATAEDIRYRHAVLRDCLAHPGEVAELRRIAAEAVERERHNYFGLFTRATPDKVLYRSLDVLDMFLDAFGELRRAADRFAARFVSEGFAAFFGCIAEDLGDSYLTQVRTQLKDLRFDRGEIVSARLGPGAHGIGYALRRPQGGWRRHGRSGLDVDVESPSGPDALAALTGRGIRTAADALAQAAEHVAVYFQTIADELGFYAAAVNLIGELDAHRVPWCLPEPATAGVTCRGLYDPALALRQPLVGNDIDAHGRPVIVITGANHGGKTTLLRALGLAALMARCGMPVAAVDFRGPLHPQVFTHFSGDVGDEAGRLDEELARMSRIADLVRPGDLLLCNESLASTNEREGAALARGVVDAMRDAGVSVVYVTHMYELAHGLHESGDARHAFLRAERLPGGDRTFRLLPGEPLATSYGDDLYRRIFGVTAGV